MKKFFAAAIIAIGLIGSALAQQAPAPAATPAATTPAAGAAPAPQHTGSVGDRNSVYTDRIPPEQIMTLDANGEKFLARHISDLSGQPRGAVIILHDSAQNPAWPFTAAALSDDLPLRGWDTLSIELPAPDIAAQPTNANGTAATPPPAASPPATTAAPTTPAAPAAGTEPRVQARIAAALKYFSDRRAKNVIVIGFGSGAIRSAEFLRVYATANSGKLDPIKGLVMVMPLNKLTGIENDLPKILPTTEAPALDIILDSEPQTKAEAEARRRAVLHQRNRSYRQVELPPINLTSDAQHSLMVKRIRAWLQQNGSDKDEK
ncbi:MAG: hypothetical protein JWM78_318 [Verrucomicrobiaceae bacterium]|nr:hypothetical protein [Verrucomicrobiaceae bacterium]